MATTIVRESKTVTCDACGIDCSKGTSLRLRDGRLSVHRHALDMHNIPCADASISRDLCDKCLEVVCEAINEACAELKAARAGGEGS